MKYLALSELVAGQVYLFQRQFNSKTITLQPATFIRVWSQSGEKDPLDAYQRPRPLVKFIIDDVETTVPIGDGTKAAAMLTTSWLERQMCDRADEVARLQAETSKLFNIYKEIKLATSTTPV